MYLLECTRVLVSVYTGSNRPRKLKSTPVLFLRTATTRVMPTVTMSGVQDAYLNELQKYQSVFR